MSAVPVDLSDEEFDRAVAAALDTLPPDLARLMDNVVVLVEEEPPEDVDEGTLGLYDGTPLTERGDGWAGSLPDRILIFRGPLLDMCEDAEEVEDEVRITVVHEVAHHFGIDDERLHELGWG
jgi:predicted Zn-dependent protease with MMP-like domain